MSHSWKIENYQKLQARTQRKRKNSASIRKLVPRRLWLENNDWTPRRWWRLRRLVVHRHHSKPVRHIDQRPDVEKGRKKTESAHSFTASRFNACFIYLPISICCYIYLFSSVIFPCHSSFSCPCPGSTMDGGAFGRAKHTKGADRFLRLSLVTKKILTTRCSGSYRRSSRLSRIKPRADGASNRNPSIILRLPHKQVQMTTSVPNNGVTNDL